MSNQEMINECVKLLRENWNPFLTWNDSLRVRPTPHNEICRLYGAAAKGESLYLFDGDEWHQLDATDKNAEYVGASVLQRLRSLKAKI